MPRRSGDSFGVAVAVGTVEYKEGNLETPRMLAKMIDVSMLLPLVTG